MPPELSVTNDQINQWLQLANNSREPIDSLPLTRDNQFVLEHRADDIDVARLSTYVCYGEYCEDADNFEAIIEVIERNL
jgi:hypothetical protein